MVIGRSDIVGKPLAMLLLHRHATVTICHSRTVDLPQVAAQADVLVAAVGRPAFVTADFVKPGATVVDVGTNTLTDRDRVTSIFGAESKKLAAFEKRGRVLSGDVHPGAAEVAGAITPVPGGVGPLTIAMLLSNTVQAAERRLGYSFLTAIRSLDSADRIAERLIHESPASQLAAERRNLPVGIVERTVRRHHGVGSRDLVGDRELRRDAAVEPRWPAVGPAP